MKTGRLADLAPWNVVSVSLNAGATMWFLGFPLWFLIIFGCSTVIVTIDNCVRS